MPQTLTARVGGKYYALDGMVPGTINLMNDTAEVPERESQGMLDFNRPDITVLEGPGTGRNQRLFKATTLLPHPMRSVNGQLDILAHAK